MKRSFKLENLGCANCAAKMESDIAKLEGVSAARIAFMTQRLTIEADDASFDSIVEKAQKICAGYEPDCVIVRGRQRA